MCTSEPDYDGVGGLPVDSWVSGQAERKPGSQAGNPGCSQPSNEPGKQASRNATKQAVSQSGRQARSQADSQNATTQAGRDQAGRQPGIQGDMCCLIVCVIHILSGPKFKCS